MTAQQFGSALIETSLGSKARQGKLFHLSSTKNAPDLLREPSNAVKCRKKVTDERPRELIRVGSLEETGSLYRHACKVRQYVGPLKIGQRRRLYMLVECIDG
ncbi:hypothetical protein VTL71DRAFT_15958 [Oculimacula yallundae]|uniref:Uncharacterized protein n=1 Tax=Oculimacula yallundae TaxID=86028 RepID=A0ABR4CD48_9HELO